MSKFVCVICGKSPLRDRVSIHRNKAGEWVCREHLDEPLPEEAADICDRVLAASPEDLDE